MNREHIIFMADASGLSLYGMGKDREQFIDYLECFAAFVASAERQAILGLAAQRTWVGLTEQEIKPCWYEACQTNLELTSQLVVYFAKAIEAKLKEKNNGC
jgi:hypothetical protein